MDEYQRKRESAGEGLNALTTGTWKVGDASAMTTSLGVKRI